MRANDKFRKVNDSKCSAKAGVKIAEQFPLFTGEIFWKLTDSKSGQTIDEGHFHNIVTLDASILIARLIKCPAIPNISEPSFGIFALAVGIGDAGWDPMNPPAATNTQRSLYNEIARKQISVSSFIDAGGSISGIPTHVVDFTVTFSEAEAVGALVELGLLGGDVNTNMAILNPILPPNGAYDPTVNVVGKDMLATYRTFKVINKPADSTLSWTYRCTF